MKTILNDRILWFDGDITFTADQLTDYILGGGTVSEQIHVDKLSSDIVNFNKYNPDTKIDVKIDMKEFDKSWNIPEKYKQINIRKYVYKQFEHELDKKINNGTPFSDDEVNSRIDRIEKELELYKNNDMFMILQTIIYIVDTFKQNNVVWGTGRGSSCASYVLYLLELHNVDPVEDEIDVEEFFK